ncbi:triose-phosphate isomerase [Paracoccus chinensis]|uniref:Triosephosphate isomerase n=1 Tax=Paracoccus chinensis TaxID=525640 RepID=A0A1G9EXS9_9RHOB|nr:triose-phosphate isomerase [Paracoccus chinensis]SDK80939.1 triosephosphate isomerase [Paracoccus chinensis]
MPPRKLAAGNWKMNGTLASLAEVDALTRDCGTAGVEILICPPATLMRPMADCIGRGIIAVAVGGQDCHAKESGAHTGDISAEQLRDAGASYVIVGHSERRADHGETDEDVAAKAVAAHRAGIASVICLGETEAQRDANETLDVIARQLAGSVPDCATAANTVIAYEPVWAIGTGRTPTNDQIAEVHAAMREALVARFADGAGFRLLYGGSVKPANAAEIFAIAHVDGALVGGASLKAADFAPIVKALDAA